MASNTKDFPLCFFFLRYIYCDDLQFIFKWKNVKNFFTLILKKLGLCFAALKQRNNHIKKLKVSQLNRNTISMAEFNTKSLPKEKQN